MMDCQNCGELIAENFCGHCGQTRELRKIDRNYAVQEFLSLVGYESGFIYTCKALLLNPGAVIREYIHENRRKITKPITFLILSSVIYSFISHYFETDAIYSEFSKKMYGDSSLNAINTWIQNNYGYANLLMILPITLWTRIFFRKYNYNFYETFILISLIMGFGMLLFSFEPIINTIVPNKFIQIQSLVLLVAMIYTSWGIGQFYGKTLKNYFKAFLSYTFGFITFQIIVTIIAIINDLFLKA